MVALGIADDEPDILRLFNIMMGKSGYPIAYMAHDGEEAVDRQRKTPADIVFLDYCMPFMDGLAASKKILSEFPDTYIFLMTGGEDLKDKVKDLSHITILKKPFAFRAIVELLKSYKTPVNKQYKD